MSNRTAFVTAVAGAFSVGVSVSFFTLPLWVGLLVQFTAHQKLDWLSFAGSMAGAGATLTAGLIALFAAYRALAPVYAQLEQLRKQNDQLLIERLGVRASHLNREEIVVQQVAANSEVFGIAVNQFLENCQGRSAEIEEAKSRFEASIVEMQAQRGHVWGSIATQELRRRFSDTALRLGSLAIEISGIAFDNNVSGPVIIKTYYLARWTKSQKELQVIAAGLYQVVRIESDATGKAIAELESRLFHDH